MLLFVLCCRSSSLLTDTFCAVRVRVAARSAMFFPGPVLIEWMWFRQRSLCAEKKPCASLGCCAPLLRRFPATSCVILYFRVSPKKHFTTILGGIDTAPSPSSSNSFIFIQHFQNLDMHRPGCESMVSPDAMVSPEAEGFWGWYRFPSHLIDVLFNIRVLHFYPSLADQRAGPRSSWGLRPNLLEMAKVGGRSGLEDFFLANGPWKGKRACS